MSTMKRALEQLSMVSSRGKEVRALWDWLMERGYGVAPAGVSGIWSEPEGLLNRSVEITRYLVKIFESIGYFSGGGLTLLFKRDCGDRWIVPRCWKADGWVWCALLLREYFEEWEAE